MGAEYRRRLRPTTAVAMVDMAMVVMTAMVTTEARHITSGKRHPARLRIKIMEDSITAHPLGIKDAISVVAVMGMGIDKT